MQLSFENMQSVDKKELAEYYLNDLRAFTRDFYKLLTDRDYIESVSAGLLCHDEIIWSALEAAEAGELTDSRLAINVQPGSGKSTKVSFWVAWCLARWPDSRFLYLSYSSTLATKHTATIKRIMQLAAYKELFGVELMRDSQAKDFFQTTAGGAVAAFGTSGSITGQDAGLPGLNRFSGAVIIDDAHKPSEVHSDTIRETVLNNYTETIVQRPRSENVPIIFIGQRLHEDDLGAFFLDERDGRQWDKVVIESHVNNLSRIPSVISAESLEILRDKSPYVYASQYQQNPIPAGGALFKESWWKLIGSQEELLLDYKVSFIVADTAETIQTYSDYTAFSFFGLYEIEFAGVKTGKHALHWIDSVQIKVEPNLLQSAFLDFLADCMQHRCQPSFVAIEKKSTGGMLLSTLREMGGIKVMDIKRDRKRGNKTNRFIDAQPYIAEGLVSISGRHASEAIKHMSAITANETHGHDDLCFIAGTKIATRYGYKNIEDIRPGDYVLTPFGLGKVTAATCTGLKPVIKKIGLEGTPNHPIFCGKSFERIDTLADGDNISALSLLELMRWRYKKLLCSMALNIDLWGRGVIILVNQKQMLDARALKDCMLRCGNFIQEREWRKALLFIIKIITLTITVLKTWSVFQLSNILKCTLKTEWPGIIARKAKRILNTCKIKLSCGISRMLAVLGIERTQKQASCNHTESTAIYAKESLKDINTPSTAQNPVITKRKPNGHASKEPIKKLVYNITVAEYGVYYANNVLVSNCDTLADGVYFGLIEKSANLYKKDKDYSRAAQSLTAKTNTINVMRQSAYSSRRG